MQASQRVSSPSAPPQLSSLAPSRFDHECQSQVLESNHLIETYLDLIDTEVGYDTLKNLRRNAKRIYGRLSKSKQAPFFLARLEALEYIWEQAECLLEALETPDDGAPLEVAEDWLAELEHLVG